MNFLKQALKVIALGLLLYSLFHNHQFLAESINIPLRLVEPVVNFLIFFLGGHLGITILSGIYRRRKAIGLNQNDNVLVGLHNLFYILLTGAFIMTTLSIFGIDYKTLFTTLSIVAAAIAIISKEFLAEIISGIIISFSREISINDYIKIGNSKGRVVDINYTKVALLNEDDDIVFFPNTKVFSSEIVNYTKKHIRKVSIEFELNLQYLETVEILEKELTASLSDFHKHIEPNSFNLKIVEIHKDSLLLKFQYVLYQINRELEREIRKTTVRRLVNFINSRKGSSKSVIENGPVATDVLAGKKPE